MKAAFRPSEFPQGTRGRVLAFVLVPYRRAVHVLANGLLNDSTRNRRKIMVSGRAGPFADA
jgi:hypothetical protein